MSSSPRLLVIVPLRLESSRIPQKVLKNLGKKSLAAHVLTRLEESLGSRPELQLLAAVDDERTLQTLRRELPKTAFEILMTDPALPSGTDRVFAAAQAWLAAHPEAKNYLRGILNVQGDMPFAGQEGLQQAADFFLGASERDLQAWPMITLAQSWSPQDPLKSLGAVKVLSSRAGRAIYFSRYPIPHSRKKPTKKEQPLCDLHIGLYGYTLETLTRLAAHAPIPMESAESLEQLRALWMDIPILVLKTEPASHESFRGIDTPEDLAWARRWAQKKPGKLVKKVGKK